MVFIWQSGTYFMLTAPNPGTAFFWGKIIYLGTTFLPAAVYYFVVSFLKKGREKKQGYLAFILAGVLFLPLLGTNLLLSGVRKYFWGYWYQAGLLHPFYLLYYLIILGLSLVYLYKAYTKEKSPLEKIRIKYVLGAFIISFVGAIDFIPDYGIEVYLPSHLPIFIYFSAIAYAITKHQLMDIKIIINRLMAYSIILIVYVIAGLIVTFTSYYLFLSHLNHLAFLSLTAFLILAGLSFHPLRLHLQTTPDKFLFRKKYLLEQAAKEIGKICHSTVDQDILFNLVNKNLKTTLNTKSIPFFLLNKGKNGFAPVKGANPGRAK